MQHGKHLQVENRCECGHNDSHIARCMTCTGKHLIYLTEILLFSKICFVNKRIRTKIIAFSSFNVEENSTKLQYIFL